MSRFHDYKYAGETDHYRQARDELLQAEIELRAKIEEVATLRRALPAGAVLQDDYQFEGNNGVVSLSSLFEAGQDCLAIYSLMYKPGGKPCPMCTSMLDGLNGSAAQIKQRISLAVVAKASIAEISELARSRHWHNLDLYSTAGNEYNQNYLGESKTGDQMPMLNLFVRDADEIRHFYGTEMMLAKSEPGQDPRHVDMLWPLWNMLDLTPTGRGNWYPTL